MKRLFTAGFIFLMLLLSACSNEEVMKNKYSFTGEGQYWNAEYIYEGTELWKEEDNRTSYSHESNDTFVLTFKGSLEEMQSIKRVDYSYETTTGGGGGSHEFDESPNEITLKSGSGGTGATIKENEIISVTVKWNDLEESFELVNKTE
ncbi:hypothetical protein [Halalkalibacter sp. APA_J-10(15)]|uniref:hypothetical protein n=1 Tax=Halalkalibacter sp. APA_J-10(15) TaxID=2933805 RepID=UPI001FF61AF2|nr:hypothetical protein [Halalkalibacter sp. APA_J-10(15)]MCK0470661.1 hypothetical protein [Halalkalibacter sp. APA_J-10(15)]